MRRLNLAAAFVSLVGVIQTSTATPVTNGLQVWLDASQGTGTILNGAPVFSWTDAQHGHQFNNANSLVPTYVEDAGGGLPAIDFGRSSGFIGDFSSTAGPLLGDATVFVIGKFGGYSHSASSSSYWFSIDSSTGQAEHTLGRDTHLSNPDALYHWRSQPSPPGFYGTNIVEPSNGDFNFYTAVYRGGGPSGIGMDGWINGSGGGTGPSDVNTDGFDTAYGSNPSQTRVGLWTSNASGLDGQIRELLIYDRVLDSEEIESIEGYLASRLAGQVVEIPEHTFTFDLSGQTNPIVPGFVPHGDPLATGTATLTIRENGTMDYDIQLMDNRYRVTQAHLYNINETSGTSGNPAHGDSIICWGGRWESNATGGNSSDFLVGHGYSNGRLQEVLQNPEDWYLMLHTEGGHFAVDNGGGLIVYDPNRSGPQETSVTGVPESERSTRFNNRVGRKLTDLVLREDNANDPAAPFYDPQDPLNQNATPFPDANSNMWVESDGMGGWQLTAEAISRGYDLETEYLFYLYDDQGPTWDFGGPEGAIGGFLPAPIVDCDFDDNGTCDLSDLDTLVGAIVDTIRFPPDLSFDLDADGDLDVDDISQWLADAGAMNLPSGNTYLEGDANLDGVVDGQDFLAWNDNKFGLTANWSEGDFNADGVTDGQDFLTWNDNKFQSSEQVSAVPEPNVTAMLMMGLCLFIRNARGPAGGV